MPLVVMCAALVLLLPACGASLLLSANRAPAPVLETGDICDPDAPSGGVPDRFEPVAAYRCEMVLTMAPVDPGYTPPAFDGEYPHEVPSDEPGSPDSDDAVPGPGEPPVTPRRFEGDLEPLLAALAMPDQPPTGGVCPLAMVFPPEIRLVDDRGRWMRPAIPRNACGQPERAGIDEAFARLTAID